MNKVLFEKNNPYVTNFINKNKIRYESISDLINCKFQKYIDWHLNTINKGIKEAEKLSLFYYKMFLDIKKNNYCEESYEFFAKKNNIIWKPISFTLLSNGVLQLHDGNHRAFILLNLNKSFEAYEYMIYEKFLKLKNNKFYQKPIHPLYNNCKYVRDNFNRYDKIGFILNKLKINSSCEIGCAEGSGIFNVSKYIDNLYGTEIDEDKYLIANSLAAISKVKILKTDIFPKEKTESYIFLSILQHFLDKLDKLNFLMDNIKHAKLIFVELPEEGSKTWHEEFILLKKPSDFITSKLQEIFPFKYLIHTDKKYAKRKTYIMLKENIDVKIFNEFV